MKRRCDSCGQPYEAVRSSSRFCGDTCKKRAQRGQVTRPIAPLVQLPGMDAEPEPDGLAVAAVRKQLAAVDREDTYLGAAALSLAARIDGSNAVMGFAALVKELRATMDAALAGTGQTADLVDELRARRDRRDAG